MKNEQSKEALVLQVISALFFLVVGIPIVSLWGGFVLADLWKWFVVPFGINPISLAHAVGLNILIGFFFLGILVQISETKGKVAQVLQSLSDSGKESKSAVLIREIQNSTLSKNKEENSKTLFSLWLKAMFYPLISWVFGYIVHLFM